MHSSSFMKGFTLRASSQLTLVRALSYVNPLGGKNHYKTLELEKSCTDKEVREAYIRLSKEHHPDKNPNAVRNDKKFVDINEAYSVLSKPATRRRYDDYLSNCVSSDQPFTSSYDELTYRYNQYKYEVAPSNDFEALIKIYEFAAGSNFVSLSVSKIFVFKDSEIAKSGNTVSTFRACTSKNKYSWKAQRTGDEVPLHKVLLFVISAMFFIGILEFQIVNQQEVEHYNTSKRRIIVNTVKSMKAENDARLRDQDRLRTMLENGAERQKTEDSL